MDEYEMIMDLYERVVETEKKIELLEERVISLMRYTETLQDLITLFRDKEKT